MLTDYHNAFISIPLLFSRMEEKQNPDDDLPLFLQKLLSEGRAFLLSLGGSEGARGPFQQAGVLTEPNSLMDSGAFLPFVLRSLKSLR